MKITATQAVLPFLLLLGGAAHAANLQPYVANYEMRRSGDALGDATFSLRQTPTGWEFDQATRGTHGMAALASADAKEQSELTVAKGVLQLSSYHYRLSTLVTSKENSIVVDPAGNRIVIRDKKHEHDFPMQPGVLDQNSVTLAIAQDLANGKRGTLSYPVATRNNVEVQRFQVGKEETVQVPAGAVRTVVVTRLRDTPNGRVTAYWFGLDNGFVPARIVQNEPNGDSWEASLVSLTH
ncbi:MAG TPA: DUF3108 domain-containing protein [Xanthomonadaceae bacterium]|jgi:hypothetical protein|nr:DUF3108 domain-containing protein [Xanthomonadaceae bacterium]